MKYFIIFLVLLCGCKAQNFSLHTEDITNMYVDYIEEWKAGCKKAFIEAHKEIYLKTPNDDIVGPNEDPAKCICKGTGVIIQGDDHKTPCPFHAKPQGLNTKNKEVITREFRR
jgi:hypothetical protein